MSSDGPKGSFVRWQSVTIGQLTYAVNLILGFAVATLGFQITLLFNDKFHPLGWQKCTFLLSMLVLLSSICFGLWCVINRLRDFRATTKVARMREGGSSDAKMQPYRDLYTKLGNCTWALFWLQIGTFGVGVLLTALALWGTISEKLL